MFDKIALQKLKLPELKEIAKAMGIKKLNIKKNDLIESILEHQLENNQTNHSELSDTSSKSKLSESSNESDKKPKRRRIATVVPELPKEINALNEEDVKQDALKQEQTYS